MAVGTSSDASAGGGVPAAPRHAACNAAAARQHRTPAGGVCVCGVLRRCTPGVEGARSVRRGRRLGQHQTLNPKPNPTAQATGQTLRHPCSEAARKVASSVSLSGGAAPYRRRRKRKRRSTRCERGQTRRSYAIRKRGRCIQRRPKYAHCSHCSQWTVEANCGVCWERRHLGGVWAEPEQERGDTLRLVSAGTGRGAGGGGA